MADRPIIKINRVPLPPMSERQAEYAGYFEDLILTGSAVLPNGKILVLESEGDAILDIPSTH